MCLLCDDEKAYQAYMNYLDAMARQGEAADKARAGESDPAKDKTLSPFFCSPINK